MEKKDYSGMNLNETANNLPMSPEQVSKLLVALYKIYIGAVPAKPADFTRDDWDNLQKRHIAMDVLGETNSTELARLLFNSADERNGK